MSFRTKPVRVEIKKRMKPIDILIREVGRLRECVEILLDHLINEDEEYEVEDLLDECSPDYYDEIRFAYHKQARKGQTLEDLCN